ncbi:hypothetical protein Tco_0987239 [Tanacetum coccineum]
MTPRRDLFGVANFPRWVEAKVVSSEVEGEKWRRLLLHQMCVAIDVAYMCAVLWAKRWETSKTDGRHPSPILEIRYNKVRQTTLSELRYLILGRCVNGLELDSLESSQIDAYAFRPSRLCLSW